MAKAKYNHLENPHTAVTLCFTHFFTECLNTSGEILFEKLDEGLTRLFNLKLFWQMNHILPLFDEKIQLRIPDKFLMAAAWITSNIKSLNYKE